MPSTAVSPLQTAIWPQSGISTEVAPHFDLFGPVGLSLTQAGADFGPGGRITTSTYYNLFNLGKWRKHCGELPLQLQLSGSGRFVLSIYAAGPDQSTRQVFSETVALDGSFRQPVRPEDLAHTDAVLFFSLTALDHARLDDFAWATTAPPRNTPDLMLSITTFRREAEVAATVERFRRFRATSELRDHIRMVIVDNGGTVTVDDGDGVVVIQNENLGGAGGFTRGLLMAEETGASHCLFMDDDASIQMEALSRTWWFLAYALDPRTAVAGGMINAAYRWQVWENGALFDLGCKPLYGGLDLRRRKHVFKMEYETTDSAPDDLYGGWWFFAFPVAQMKHLPFPFFVRGDDVSFSLSNDFAIVTLPGVASIQESFTDKASPLTWYLDFRSHLAHHLDGSAKDRSWRELQAMVRSFYLRNVLRFHYDTLSAVNLALEDVMRGPAFFDEHADMAQRRADLKALTTTEAWQPIPTAPRQRLGKYPRPLRALWLATLNGHLLPLGGRIGSRLTLSAPYREDYRKTYGAKEITYLNADGTAAYVVRRDGRRFRAESMRLLRNTLRLRRLYPKMREEWRQGYATMTSNEYWVDKLRLNSPAEDRDQSNGPH
ncbi:glycosyltransferase family protein [Microbacterium tumbae]